MKEKKFIAIEYANACYVKFDNKRAIVESVNENEIGIAFKKICTKETIKESTTLEYSEGNKIKVTSIKISVNAAIALHHALNVMLQKHSRKFR